MICDKCGKTMTKDDSYHCGGCGAILCGDCMKTVIKEAGDEIEYCNDDICWKQRQINYET
jgi:hypothetical protein